MNFSTKLTVQTRCLLAAACTFGFFLLVFHFTVQIEDAKLKSDKNFETLTYANLLRAEVDRELNELLFISHGLASYLTVYKHELDHGMVQAILADLYSRAKHVHNLGVAIGYKLTYIYPIEGNEKAIGADYSKIPKQWPKLKKAIESRTGILDGPFNLLQGGRGLVYRYPIYIDDRYWGLLSTIINTDGFLNSAFSNVTDGNYSFAIRSHSTREVFYGKPELFDSENAMLIETRVPNGTWEWAFVRKPSAPAKQLFIMKWMGFALSLLLATLVYVTLRSRYRFSEKALRDSLTHLPNRRLLEERLALSLARATKNKRHMAVMMIDIDHFKHINDSYGHDLGDEVLKITARIIKQCIRSEDTLGRTGGDEFVLVLDRLQSHEDAQRIVSKIIGLFQRPLRIQGQEVEVHLSIGGTIYEPGRKTSTRELLKEADIALYEVKGAGRNGYAFFASQAIHPRMAATH